VVFSLAIEGQPGQTLFMLCGPGKACAANQTYTRTFASLPHGVAPYAIQRVVGSQVVTIKSGNADLTDGDVVTASVNG
jgi:hypothetical protein